MSETLENVRPKKGEVGHINQFKVVSIALVIKKSIVSSAKVLLVAR